MESSSSRLEQEKRKQAEIRKQIALLQAQLVDIPDNNVGFHTPSSPKRKQPEPTLLAPPTPSPKKRKLDHKSNGSAGSLGSSSAAHSTSRDALQNLNSASLSTPRPVPGKLPVGVHHMRPAPSNVLTKLANLNRRPIDSVPTEAIIRSCGFTERPQPPPTVSDVDMGPPCSSAAPKRDDHLVLVEDLEVGPVDHKPSFDDPNFEQLEPNSGIRLSVRILPHDDIQDHLRGRYYLSPSRLYSAIRLLPDKQGYDVPVAGDWITIAVVAERGPVKFSRAPVGVGREDDGNGVEKHEDPKPKGKRKDESSAKPTGKKYVNIKLIDFGARSRSSSSATGGKAVIRGDAFLSLLLFESDGFDLVAKEDGGKAEKVYKGGSRGAFETLSKLKEGDVIALLNPKILKPFQRATDNPHPTNNILALTPESASSIAVIGRARDLGMCAVVKRDGKVCGGWCDKRVSDVCEWHVQNAVERRRAGRAEFSIGTSGLSTTSAPKRKPAYDPTRQWGLKPADAASGSGGATYVVSGHVVSGSGSGPDSRSLHIAENMGREGQAKAKRKLSGKDADRALKALLERDKEGMKAVMKAREVAARIDEADGGKKSSKKNKGKEKSRVGEEEIDNRDLPDVTKNSYSAEVIKQLGFDPTAKAGQTRGGDSTMQKLKALAEVQSARKDIALGPRPGQRIRSGVVAPSSAPKGASPVVAHVTPHDSGDSEDDLEQALFGKPLVSKMVDLDE